MKYDGGVRSPFLLALGCLVISAPASAFVPPSFVSGCPPGMAQIRGGTYKGAAIEPFCLEITEVTVLAYRACVARGVCPPPSTVADWKSGSPDSYLEASLECNGNRDDRLDHPANCLEQTVAAKYCASLGRRLPTDRELEWAGQGADAGTLYPWGNHLLPEERACWSTSKQSRKATCPVFAHPGTLSPQGIYGLSGNVFEWSDPGPGHESGIPFYGGCYLTTDGAQLKHDFFNTFPSNARTPAVGFRCAK